MPEDEDGGPAFPAALGDCFAVARRLRAEFLKFDCDVEPVAELRFFEDEPGPSAP